MKRRSVPPWRGFAAGAAVCLSAQLFIRVLPWFGLRMACELHWRLAFSAGAALCLPAALFGAFPKRAGKIACASALLALLPQTLLLAVWCRETGYYTFTAPNGAYQIQVKEADSWCCSVSLRQGLLFTRPLGGFVSHNLSYPFRNWAVSTAFEPYRVWLYFPNQPPICLDLPT